ncbi:MAG: hypothetical protein A2W00_02380 [Candidatus Eisenbacteria bacterium RBG_16_71_46]|nr:MAG: hypothetical protein A2W00_02380 [Candidatus Eisenbacteria bacterium RBG_16_71_46]
MAIVRYPSEAAVERFAAMALAALGSEYPYHLSHVVRSDDDVCAPRILTPAFASAFDWHSSVHGHWCLARLLRVLPRASFAAAARATLAASLTRARLEAEAAYLDAPGREGFERPYGLAWLLQLAAELRGREEAGAASWREALAPLESLAASRLAAWVRVLPWPVRSGEHSQTAFALGLALDWARAAEQREFEGLTVERARSFFGGDTDAPVAYEPSGNDFLSPALGEADLMRRVLPRAEFASWLDRFLPPPGAPAESRWLTPVSSPDRADGKLSHLDGLNLSRSWMLEGIAAGLPPGHRRVRTLREAAVRHRAAGLTGATGEHYAGSHWLGSFAVYLLTGGGLG